MEIGLGIHGEPGVSRSAVLPAVDVAQLLVRRILKDLSGSGCHPRSVVVLMNNLGATTSLVRPRCV